jgi:uncharacterized protein (TIGR02246 family)
MKLGRTAKASLLRNFEEWSVITMRRILLLLLLIVACAGVARSQGTSGNEADAQTVKEVLKVEQERNQAVLNGDADVLERIYSDDFAYTNESGETPTKAQFVANFRSGKRKFIKYTHDDIHVHVFGNTVVLNGRSTSTYLYNGTVYENPRRFTLVYVKQDGKWRVAALHVSTIPKQ